MDHWEVLAALFLFEKKKEKKYPSQLIIIISLGNRH